jgi:four helix bundle protein
MPNTTNSQIISQYDIHNRIFDFVVRVVKLVKSLVKNETNIIIIPQLLRSVTSIGANDQEADGTLTKKDFIHCYTIVRKETKETLFWLKLIAETNPEIKRKMSLLIKENQEIVSIVSAIINKSRQKI